MIAAVAGLLTACATATPYQPAVSDRYGFEEQRIENNRMRITFRGNTLTDRETVETYLLYRAAELTLQNGHDYFIVANRETEEHSQLRATGPYRPRFAFDYWYFSPRRGWSPWYDPFWDEPSSYREVTRYEAGDRSQRVRCARGAGQPARPHRSPAGELTRNPGDAEAPLGSPLPASSVRGVAPPAAATHP
jgi:hypothetical protein